MYYMYEDNIVAVNVNVFNLEGTCVVISSAGRIGCNFQMDYQCIVTDSSME